MAVLITGGTGLIGSYAARKLIEQGERAVLYDVSPQLDQINDILNKVVLVKGDILDLPELIRTVKKESVDRIIHTAGLLSLGAKERPYLAVRTNIEGTANILELARLNEIRRIVFCSSGTVCDLSFAQDRPFDEELPLKPTSVYATTKLAGEFLGINYADIYGLDFVALRFSIVYGPGYTLGGYGGQLFQQVFLDYVLKGRAVAKKPSQAVADYVYVKDAANAVVLACHARNLHHRIFHIGSGEIHDIFGIINTIKKILPGGEIEILEPEPTEHLGYLSLTRPYDVSRAQQELGYIPEYTLEKALRDYLDWTRSKYPRAPAWSGKRE